MIRAEARIDSRDPRYGRRFGFAVVVSAAVHALLLFATPAPRQWTEMRDAPHIGYAGPELYIGELNPQEFPVEQQEQLAAERRAAGALVEEPVEVEPESNRRDRIRQRMAAGLAGEEEATNPVIELGEDWALRSTSSPTTRTDEFVILQMVRPRYPPVAIAAGVEGLIRAQAWVDES
ncbi:MAG: hypothetical protein GF346_00530, partial [Candidatus Eisenbacteria bacterium]|nr:hypothetical protein [Candidatus Latescibacterota bacterium]MBD3300916.1 hypothetical protein [Candidatus Eisenbacteria bacterium]